jgi:hypothetical protein
VHRKRIKDILAHTVGPRRSRREVISQFTVSGLFGGVTTQASPSGGSGSGAQALLGGAVGGATSGVGNQVAALSQQLIDLRTVQQTNIDSMLKNTQALIQNTARKSNGTSSANTAGNLLSSIFGSSFGLSPIVKGLVSLFGGGSTTVQPLVPFTLPPSVQYQGGYSASSGGQVQPIGYGQSGGARATAPAPATTVQIQVNAMDSRSFLDHSDDIARAVREAMLHSNSLNDVISDL